MPNHIPSHCTRQYRPVAVDRQKGPKTNPRLVSRTCTDHGATVARELHLSLGVAITAQQIAQLTSDIVWLVEQSVTLPDGSTQRVLVPRSGDLKTDGTLIAGETLRLSAEGDLVNSGSIAGYTLAELSATNIRNLGGEIDGRNVGLTATRDIDNLGGKISAVDRLVLNAGRDINVASTTVNTTANPRP